MKTKAQHTFEKLAEMSNEEIALAGVAGVAALGAGYGVNKHIKNKRAANLAAQQAAQKSALLKNLAKAGGIGAGLAGLGTIAYKAAKNNPAWKTRAPSLVDHLKAGVSPSKSPVDHGLYNIK